MTWQEIIPPFAIINGLLTATQVGMSAANWLQDKVPHFHAHMLFSNTQHGVQPIRYHRDAFDRALEERDLVLTGKPYKQKVLYAPPTRLCIAEPLTVHNMKMPTPVPSL